MRLTWLGHSSVLLEVDGVRVLADPVLRHWVVGLRRAATMPAQARALMRGEESVDVVLISHLHHDHCDLPTLRRLDAGLVVAPPGAGAWLGKRGVLRVREPAVDSSLDIGRGVAVTAVPADHPSGRTGGGPDAWPVGHVVDGPSGSAWLAGDTALHPVIHRLRDGTRTGQLDLAAVPVWGWGPNLGPGHLDPAQAAEAVRRSGARHAIPVHWGTLHPTGMQRRMRSLLRSPGPDFAAALAALDCGAQAHVLGVGESVTAPSSHK